MPSSSSFITVQLFKSFAKNSDWRKVEHKFIYKRQNILGQFLFIAQKTWFLNRFHRLICVRDSCAFLSATGLFVKASLSFTRSVCGCIFSVGIYKHSHSCQPTICSRWTIQKGYKVETKYFLWYVLFSLLLNLWFSELAKGLCIQ